MKLGKSQKTNQFLESLKAEGENIVEDVRPTSSQSRPTAPPPTDPITFTIEEKLNATLKKDGGISSFDVQGTLSLQLLKEDDGQIQVEVLSHSLSLKFDSFDSLENGFLTFVGPISEKKLRWFWRKQF